MCVYCILADFFFFFSTTLQTVLFHSAAHQYYFSRIQQTLIPSLAAILQSCHQHSVEVIHTFVECLTKDGRDQSLDYKISGFVVPKGMVWYGVAWCGVVRI